MSIISAFPAGVGAKLNVKAYASTAGMPSTEKTGAIAVITTTALGDCHASATAPGSPAAGDIWIWLGSNANATVSLKNNIGLPARAVYQYAGSLWVYRESYVYTGTAWADITLYVYYYGTEVLTSFAKISGSGTFTKQAAALMMYVNASTTEIQSDTAIDLTDIASITVIHTTTITDYFHSLRLMPGPAAQLTLTVGSSASNSLDVSSITGAYYLNFLYLSNESRTNYIHSILLAK